MIEYRFAKKEDLLQVAMIHKEQFPTHYLGQFSISLLESFYRNLLDGEYIFIVVNHIQIDRIILALPCRSIEGQGC